MRQASRLLASPGGSARPRMQIPVRKLELLAIPLLFVVLWFIGSAVVSHAIPSPTATWQAASDGLSGGRLSGALLITVRTTAIAFVVASALGLSLGVWLGSSPFWAAVFEAPLLWLYAIPKVTLFPIFLLALGLGIGTNIAFGVFHGFFPLTLFVMAAIRGMPKVMFKFADIYGLSKVQRLTRIIAPAVLPSMIVGLRYCFSLTFLGVVVVEMFAARDGAGYQLMIAVGRHRVPEIFAIALVLSAIGLAVNGSLLVAQNWYSDRISRSIAPTSQAGG